MFAFRFRFSSFANWRYLLKIFFICFFPFSRPPLTTKSHLVSSKATKLTTCQPCWLWQLSCWRWRRRRRKNRCCNRREVERLHFFLRAEQNRAGETKWMNKNYGWPLRDHFGQADCFWKVLHDCSSDKRRDSRSLKDTFFVAILHFLGWFAFTARQGASLTHICHPNHSSV